MDTEEHVILKKTLACPNDESKMTSINAVEMVASKSGNRVRESLSLRSTAAMSIHRQEPRPIRRQMSAKAGRNKHSEADTAAPSSTGLPLPTQLSRSSSLRQPTGLISRGSVATSLQSRNASIVKNSMKGDSLGIKSVLSPGLAQKDMSTTPPMPMHGHSSTRSNPASIHHQSRSSSAIVEKEPGKRFPGTQDRLRPEARPQFSTYQQHFTPKKQNLQLEPVKVPPSTTQTGMDFNYIMALQNELLQLQWMFLSSRKTLKAWSESGFKKIKEQQEKQIQDACNVKSIEQSQQDRVNGAALRDWLAKDKDQQWFNRVESLSQCVQTLTDLTQPYERLSDVMNQFEAWYEITRNILDGRVGDSQREEFRCIRPLGQPWAETVAALVQVLESCLRNLEQLGGGDGSSGLELVLDGHTRFNKTILEELEAMQLIHSTVLKQENDWIRVELSGILLTKNKFEVSQCDPQRPGAWDCLP
ncbi:hypothetical protein EPUS_02159 [Endocarpon pusillum Z07020]|uniref:Uncharacterized protein n=1 Tax=Endocarpon pusillum (strain Z07020 / HMAS-L-300199) TaxID=1263415 RepID=U1G4N0_ENDPU|nr:uncharacterized protein EPUS_02159 [Endocarpon pusillum Z07020]ERF72272.1 hypothetical protein EPUS_02159 [Endocarpon pusillum Z07020]